MLLKNQKEDTTDYTKDWPARYYDIPTGALRREHLKRARSEGFAVPADSYREMLCERRFFSEKKRRHCGWFFPRLDHDQGFRSRRCLFFPEKASEKRTAHLHEGSLSLPG